MAVNRPNTLCAGWAREVAGSYMPGGVDKRRRRKALGETEEVRHDFYARGDECRRGLGEMVGSSNK